MLVIPQDLSRAVLNVMNNACHAVWKKQLSAGENYHPEVSVCVKVEGANLVIGIADNGIGMNEEVKRRIFEDFFTTKSSSEAAGIGLYLSREILQSYGGDVVVKSVKDEYSEFIITLPEKNA